MDNKTKIFKEILQLALVAHIEGILNEVNNKKDGQKLDREYISVYKEWKGKIGVRDLFIVEECDTERIVPLAQKKKKKKKKTPKTCLL